MAKLRIICEKLRQLCEKKFLPNAIRRTISVFKGGKGDNFHAVGACESHATTGENDEKIGLTERNLMLFFVILLYQTLLICGFFCRGDFEGGSIGWLWRGEGMKKPGALRLRAGVFKGVGNYFTSTF